MAVVRRREIPHFALENEHGPVFYSNLAYKNTKKGTEVILNFNMEVKISTKKKTVKC